jgi:putative Mg2+ transporter-C (MgtC) family protein
MENLTELLPSLGDSLIRILAAIICGGLIGYERERKGKPAGLRTNILICLGATLYMIISELVALKHPAQFSDPGRIAAQVVVGIGFIGAGTIIQSRGTVAGLTTAATIWVVAAIGLIIGAGYPLTAMIFTGIVLLTLAPIRFIHRSLMGRCDFIEMDIFFPDDGKTKSMLTSILNEFDVDERNVEFSVEENRQRLRISYCHKHPAHFRFLPELWRIDGITAVKTSR